VGGSSGSFDDVEAIERRQDLSNLVAIIMQSTGIIGLFESLVGFASTHVGALRGGKESSIAQVVDSLLPGLAGLFGRVDVLDTVALASPDHVGDPSALYLNGGGPI